MMQAPVIAISSADGWNQFSLSWSRADNSEASDVVFGQLEVIGKFWDRREAETGPIQSEPRLDHKGTIFQARISIRALHDLKRHLKNDTNDLNVTVRLSQKDPKLELTIAPRSDFISSSVRPVFSMRFETQRMKIESAFVVDQTCLEFFLKALQSALNDRID